MGRKFDKDAAFNSIVDTIQGEPEEVSSVEPSGSTPNRPEDRVGDKELREKLIQQTVYITKKQQKALKMRTALSEDPNEKDLSSIIRNAIDSYLADTLKTLE